MFHKNPYKHNNFIELSIIRVHCSWIYFHFSYGNTFFSALDKKKVFKSAHFCHLLRIYLSKSVYFTNYRSNVNSHFTMKKRKLCVHKKWHKSIKFVVICTHLRREPYAINDAQNIHRFSDWWKHSIFFDGFDERGRSEGESYISHLSFFFSISMEFR